MAQQTINIGAVADDGTGDTLRDGGDKINDNFTELYALVAALAAAGSSRPPVRAASTANGTLATAFENGDTLDGVVLATGDRILLKNQSSGAENGIYVVNASGAPTRATDADSSAELVSAAVWVAEGTANADRLFVCTTNAPIVVNTTALTFIDPFAALGSGSLDGLSDVITSGVTQGSVLYFNGTDWVFLGPGTSGHYLKTQGAGANPVWAAVSGGSGSAYPYWLAVEQGVQPSSNFAVPDSRNGHPVWAYNDTTDQSIIFTDRLPDAYTGGGLYLDIYWMAATATSGDCIWNGSIERVGLATQDTDSDSFATAQATTTTAPGTSGHVAKTRITFSSGANMDSLAAGEVFRAKVTRNASGGGDTMSGNAQLLRAEVVPQ